jgi:hypothetical protein
MHIPGMWQDVDTGALPTLFAATSPDAVPDGHYGPGGLFGLRGQAGIAGRSKRAQGHRRRRGVTGHLGAAHRRTGCRLKRRTRLLQCSRAR